MAHRFPQMWQDGEVIERRLPICNPFLSGDIRAPAGQP